MLEESQKQIILEEVAAGIVWKKYLKSDKPENSLIVNLEDNLSDDYKYYRMDLWGVVKTLDDMFAEPWSTKQDPRRYCYRSSQENCIRYIKQNSLPKVWLYERLKQLPENKAATYQRIAIEVAQTILRHLCAEKKQGEAFDISEIEKIVLNDLGFCSGALAKAEKAELQRKKEVEENQRRLKQSEARENYRS